MPVTYNMIQWNSQTDKPANIHFIDIQYSIILRNKVSRVQPSRFVLLLWTVNKKFAISLFPGNHPVVTFKHLFSICNRMRPSRIKDKFSRVFIKFPQIA